MINKLILATLSTIIVVIIIILATDCDNNNTTLVSTQGCCSITVDKHVDGTSYQVTWIDNTQLNTNWTEYVEVEYPDTDYTLEEQLAYELDWTVSEMKELCFTYHGGTIE
jgi:hypothetical protein